MKKILFVTLSVVLIFGQVFLCFAAAPPIKIGAIMSLTGEDAVVGAGVRSALEYRVEQYGGHVADRKIQILFEDDATNPTTGVDKAKKLVQHDKIDALIGPLHGAVAMGVANFMSKTGIPNIILMEKSIQALKMGGNNIFLPFGTHEGTGYYAGAYASDKLGYKTATAVYEDFVAGHEFVGGAIKGFEKNGGKIIQKQPVAPGSLDFSPNLAALKQADCVLFWFTPALSQRFVSQYYQSGQKMPLILALASVLFSKSLADIGDKTLGIVGSCPYSSLIDTTLNKRYVEAFEKKYGFVPSAQDVSADVALTLYLEALKTTNGDASSGKVIDALHKIKVETPAGYFSFTPEGLGIGDQYILKVVKTPERYDWGMIDKYSQIPLDTPK